MAFSLVWWVQYKILHVISMLYHCSQLSLDLVQSRRYVPLKLGWWFKDMGISPKCIHEMDWWQEETHLDTKIRITMTPAQVRKPSEFWRFWMLRFYARVSLSGLQTLK